MQELLVIFEVKKMNTLSGIGFIREKLSMIHIMILSHLLSLRAMRIEFRNIIARVKRRRESEFLKG